MGGRGYGGGGRGRVYTYRYTVTTRMTCIKMGSDESHFNVSLIVMDKVTRQWPQTTTFEEKGEPKPGIEPRSFRLPAYRLTARPNRLSTTLWQSHGLCRSIDRAQSLTGRRRKNSSCTVQSLKLPPLHRWLNPKTLLPPSHCWTECSVPETSMDVLQLLQCSTNAT